MSSTHAETAKAIRKELKANFPNTKFKVTSSIFAGGNAVHIDWTDGEPIKEVERITNKYQYGSFDGMIDLYEYTNSREDIPQVKYVQCQRTLSEEKIKEFKAEYNNNYSEKLPENLGESVTIGTDYLNAYQLAYRMLYDINLNTTPILKALK